VIETAGQLLSESYQVPDEDRVATAAEDAYTKLVGRLSHQSVVKHFDAYGDIDWDSPEFAIDRHDLTRVRRQRQRHPSSARAHVEHGQLTERLGGDQRPERRADAGRRRAHDGAATRVSL